MNTYLSKLFCHNKIRLITTIVLTIVVGLIILPAIGETGVALVVKWIAGVATVIVTSVIFWVTQA